MDSKLRTDNKVANDTNYFKTFQWNFYEDKAFIWHRLPHQKMQGR